jgi:hypothetical protein
MSVFLAKMAQADIIEQAEDGDVDWSCVARLPNDQVLPTMRRLHGYD